MRNFELECADSEYDEKDGFVVAYFDVRGFPEELQDKYNPSTCGFALVDWSERFNEVDVTYCDGENDVTFFFDGHEVSEEEFQRTLGLTDEEIKQIRDETVASAGHEAYRYEDSIYENRG